MLFPQKLKVGVLTPPMQIPGISNINQARALTPVTFPANIEVYHQHGYSSSLPLFHVRLRDIAEAWLTSPDMGA